MISSTLTQFKEKKADLLGAGAGTLCLIHCLATPFLFVATAEIATHHDHHHHAPGPAWWGFIDVFFLLIGLAAVYWAVKNTSKLWMKVALYASWVFLAFVIFNEKFEGIHLAHEWIYAPTLSLVGLHLYNRRYCQCEEEDCLV